jgi:hypothetical protein
MSDESRDEQLDALAEDLVAQAESKYEETQQAQQEFLESVAEESGAEILETECNLIAEYTVPLKAKLTGDIMDRMGVLEDRLERMQAGDAAAYEVSETADDISQILADIIDDPDWHKSKFYAAYEQEGLAPLGVMIERVFESLKQERERRKGAADGFRPE